MPELPEVESVRAQLEDGVLNKKLKSVSKSRLSLRKPFLFSNQKIKNMSFTEIQRWGKKLILKTNSSLAFDVSLGMTGSFRFESGRYKKKKHDHVFFNFQDGESLVFTDPRRFGWVQAVKEEDISLKGWDPLLSPKQKFEELVVNKAIKKEVSAYTFLMDQNYISGLGNIYVQEILFRAGVSPFRIVKNCSPEDWKKIQSATRVVLNQALKHGGSTIINYQNAKGESGNFQNKLKVYCKKKGEPCKVCKTPLKHIQLARSISYCPSCQT